MIEAVTIINWFNPVVYFYRFAIKHTHEFIADRQAIQSGTDKAHYAQLLLSQTFNVPAHQLVNPFFNKSLLKQRIIMLQKNKSHRIALIKYGLSAPLFILMLILSSATVNNSKTVRLINKKAELIFLRPAAETLTVDVKIIPQPSAASRTAVEKHTVAAKLPGNVNSIFVAKNDTIPKKDDKVFTSVEQVPGFPGGLQAFYTFLGKNIRYPATARKNKTQGRVIISFIVEKDGSITNVKIVRGIGDGCDEEAARVLNISPKWSPGIQNGKPVRVAYTVPIAFTIEPDSPTRPTEKKTGAVNEDKSPNSYYVVNTDSNAVTGKTFALTLKNYSITPLLILDGKEIANLNAVNPEDIQSVSILKDKAATALYGPKGTSGVVIITSKGVKLKLFPVYPAPVKQ